jgi:hypothetical protein
LAGFGAGVAEGADWLFGSWSGTAGVGAAVGAAADEVVASEARGLSTATVFVTVFVVGAAAEPALPVWTTVGKPRFSPDCCCEVVEIVGDGAGVGDVTLLSGAWNDAAVKVAGLAGSVRLVGHVEITADAPWNSSAKSPPRSGSNRLTGAL